MTFESLNAYMREALDAMSKHLVLGTRLAQVDADAKIGDVISVRRPR